MAIHEGTLPMDDFEGTTGKDTRASMEIAAPLRHSLPWFVSWVCAFGTAVSVGFVGWVMAMIDTYLVSFKYNFAMQNLLLSHGLFVGVLALIGISCLFAAIAAVIVQLYAPICAGSGVPEAKAFMNGNEIKGLFKLRNVFIRAGGAVLSVAAGYPIGREGPMLGIGGQLGFCMVRFFGRPFLKQRVDMGGNLEVTLVDDRRYGHAKRIGFVIGAAAGIAVAFRAPIGGLLYVLQEATVTSWHEEITTKAFICCVVSVIVFVQVQLLLDLSIHRLLIFSERPEGGIQDRSWEWVDIPYFIVLSAFLGWLASLWSIGRFYVWKRRRKLHKQMEKRVAKWGTWLKYFKIYEAVFIAGFCALVFGVAPTLVSCKPCPSFCGEDHACGLEHRNVTTATTSSLFLHVASTSSDHNDVDRAHDNGDDGSRSHAGGHGRLLSGTSGHAHESGSPSSHGSGSESHSSLAGSKSSGTHASNTEGHEDMDSDTHLSSAHGGGAGTHSRTDTSSGSHGSSSETHGSGSHGSGSGAQSSTHGSSGSADGQGDIDSDMQESRSESHGSSGAHGSTQGSSGDANSDSHGSGSVGGPGVGSEMGGSGSETLDTTGTHGSSRTSSGSHGGGHGPGSETQGSTSTSHGSSGTHGSSSGAHGSSSHGSGHGGDHGGHHCLAYVQYTCESGSYDEMATLLLTNAEAAVQHLFSRDAHPLHLNTLLLVVVIYTCLSMFATGIGVPMGSFVPAMLIGAAVGRLQGEALQEQNFLSDPGLFAFVGSAAMLGGATHFSVSIAVLLVEGSHDLNMVGPMMIGISVAVIVSKAVRHHAYDEQLIEAKGVPFLDSEMTAELDTSGLSAGNLLENVASEAVLQRVTSVEAVGEALRQCGIDGAKLDDFPVLDDGGVCVGTTKRIRLERLHEAFVGVARTDDTQASDEDVALCNCTGGVCDVADDDDDLSNFIEGLARQANKDENGDFAAQGVPVHRIMDDTPYTILETLTVPRLYPLFIRAHCAVACVLSTEGFFKGIVTRASLIKAAQKHGHGDHHKAHDERKKKKRQAVARPRTHRLPKKVVFTIILLTVIILTLTNFCMVWVDSQIVTWKFDALQDIITAHGVGVGGLFLAGCGMGLALIASSIVIFVQLNFGCEIAGSGIPEAKGFINGNVIEDFFEPIPHVARIVCMVLAAAAGFPIGREGPMVAIGGLTGYFVAAFLTKGFVKQKIAETLEDSASEYGGKKIEADVGDTSMRSVFIDQERYAHAKLSGFILGAAAGIAVAFSAPIGGILYMFEEVTVTSWPPGFLFEVFTCTALTVLFSRALQNAVMQSSFHRFLMFFQGAEGYEVWRWIDVPFFLLLGAAAGISSALYSKGLFKIWSFRRRKFRELGDKGPYAKIAATVLYAGFVAIVISLVPLLMPECHVPPGSDGHGSTHGTMHGDSHGSASTDTEISTGVHHRLLSEGAHDEHGFDYMRYDCPEGEFNEVATLILSVWEGAVKHLFSPKETGLEPMALLIALIFYVFLAIQMPGLSVPMGSFIPSMLIGSLMGRLLGTLLQQWNFSTSHAGMYAVVGAGAFLGGMTHMTLAIVVLLVEAAHDLSLIEPAIIGIFFGRACSQLLSPHAYDEQLIVAKGVPFLEAQLPDCLVSPDNTALRICQKVPEDAILFEDDNIRSVEAALAVASKAKNQWLTSFPVVNTEHVCVGTVTKSRLEGVVRAHNNQSFCGDDEDPPEKTEGHGSGLRLRRRSKSFAFRRSKTGFLDESEEFTRNRFNTGRQFAREDEELGLGTMFSEECHGDTIRLCRLMDPSPYTVLQDMPAARFLLLFTKVGANNAVVMNGYGGFVGIITKQSFIDFSTSAHHGSHDSHDEHGHGNGHASGIPIKDRWDFIKTLGWPTPIEDKHGSTAKDSVSSSHEAGSHEVRVKFALGPTPSALMPEAKRAEPQQPIDYIWSCIAVPASRLAIVASAINECREHFMNTLENPFRPQLVASEFYNRSSGGSVTQGTTIGARSSQHNSL